MASEGLSPVLSALGLGAAPTTEVRYAFQLSRAARRTVSGGGDMGLNCRLPALRSCN